MGDNSRIEWTEATWNPVVGCDRVSSGCAQCYAIREVHRLASNPRVGATYAGLVERQSNGQLDWTGMIHLLPERLDIPLRWKRPRMIFVNSMSDLFHERVPFDFIAAVFGVMALCRHHVFQVLTKRPDRMRRILANLNLDLCRTAVLGMVHTARNLVPTDGPWPLPNVWLGVSVEDQRASDERIPPLLETPAAIRFVSAEPLLGQLDLQPYLESAGDDQYHITRYRPALDWVIVGGESGGPANRALVEVCGCRLHDRGDDDPNGPSRLIDGDGRERPWRGGLPRGKGWPGCEDCHGSGFRPKDDALEWVRSLRDQCVAGGVSFFWKQWGGPRPKSAGRLLDGRTWGEMPSVRAHNLASANRRQE